MLLLINKTTETKFSLNRKATKKSISHETSY